jgi:ATP-dependent exoDNAse (exonuclease V) beta subunit
VAVNQQEKVIKNLIKLVTIHFFFLICLMQLCGFTTLHILANMTEDIVAEWITTLVKDYGADINARYNFFLFINQSFMKYTSE